MNKNELNEFSGKKLQMMRLAYGISCNTVGRELGVSSQQIQKYETGQNSISIDKISRLSQIFRVPITAFFPDDNCEKQSEMLQPSNIKLLKKINQISEEHHESIHSILFAIIQLIKNVENMEKI